MRIAHILWSLGTGGAENIVADIVSEQVKNNEVALFVVNDLVEDYILQKIDQRVQLHLLLRKTGSRNPWPIIRLNALLAKFHPDIIHTHSYQLINLVYWPFGKRVRTIHNTNNNPVEYPKFDALISISKAVRDFTTSQGFDSVEVDNGIAVGRINHDRRQAFHDGRLHIVQVSRLSVEQKGQDILLKALSILKDKLNVEDFVMHFIGDGEDRLMLEKMASDLGLGKFVVFEGKKTQPWIYQHLCEYGLFVQPSRYEGYGLTVAEAVAARVPVLVSNIEGPLEIIDGGRVGMTFKSEDAEDCARQIKKFIMNGRNDEQVDEAYQRVVSLYDVSITARKYLDVYKSLLDQNK